MAKKGKGRKKKSGKSRMTARQKKMQKAWDKGGEAPEMLPVGTYAMRLANAEKTESLSTGRDQVHRQHVVLSGKHEGFTVDDYMQLETDRGPFYIRRWIELMGYDVPSSYDALDDVLESMVEGAPTYRAKVTHSKDGQFTNVRPLKLIDAESDEEEDEEDEDVEEDEDEDEEEEEDGDEDEDDEEEEGDEDVEEDEDEDEEEEDEEDDEEEDEEEGEDDEEEEEEEEEGDDGEKRDLLVAFCEEFDIKVSKKDTYPDLIAKIGEYEWTPEMLDKDQLKLLEALEEDHEVTLITRPEKKKKGGKSKVSKK